MQSQNPKPPVSVIPEYYLYWTYQSRDLLLPTLYTTDMVPLEIVEPGVRNSSDGPDFVNALLRINNILYRGDIEFHIHWQDWLQHGHMHDSRYNRVILHILWELSDDISRDLDERFPHMILSQYIKPPLTVWLDQMKDLEENRTNSLSDHRFPSHSDLRSLAWERFKRKAEQLRSWVVDCGWEAALYMGLARALGYQNNSDPFQEMVRQIPPQKLLDNVNRLQRSPLVFWLLLGIQTGLFDRPFRATPGEGQGNCLQTIQKMRSQLGSRIPFKTQELIQWHFGRTRPHNNPYFRLAGYSQLFFQYQLTFFDFLLERLSSRLPLKPLLVQLEKDICLELSPGFVPFFRELMGNALAPARSMGKTRLSQFLINIILPLYHYWAEIRDSKGFQKYLEEIYFTLPATESNGFLNRLKLSGRSTPQLSYAYQQHAILELGFRENAPVSLPI